jgi:hypothetical protein
MNVIILLSKEEAKERQKTLDWLSPENFRSRYDEIRNDRVEGSGSWFLKSDEFRVWAEGASNSLIVSGTGTIDQSDHC